jgi:hypothetical protein
MTMRSLLAAFGAVLLSVSAAAQTPPNPVMEHFRAYRAAIAQGDLAGADAAATAALAASEARDGDGGRTAILALNLASLRLERGDRAGALQPAQRAHTLATTRTDANLDPLLAGLVLERARLTPEGATEGLAAAISQARQHDDLAGDIYLAAVDLGRRSLTDGRFVQSADAWQIAADTAAAAPDDSALARADALIASAVALIYEAAKQRGGGIQPIEVTAQNRLREALTIADQERGLFVANTPADRATTSYGNAAAWLLVLNARLGRLPRPWTNAGVRGRPAAESVACDGRVLATEMPRFPSRALSWMHVGAVVVRFETNAAGDIISREIIGAAPSDSQFASNVRDVLPRWDVAWDETPSCTRQTEIIQTVRFVFP